jgi:acetolactate synthase-1/2/3 large subunit
MEIDSAKRHGAKVVFIVANNAAWNIERLDQEMNYGGRVVGTTLAFSDYAMMARAFGLHGERVTDPARLRGALDDAFANAPALLDVVVTQYAMSSDAGKGLGWVYTYQALTAWTRPSAAVAQRESSGWLICSMPARRLRRRPESGPTRSARGIRSAR